MKKPKKKKVILKKLPKVIKVKKNDYRVVPRSRSWEYRNEGTKGQISFDPDWLIELVKLDRFDTVDTVIHELLHAVIRSNKRLKFKNGKYEETVVKNLSLGLTDILFTNPQLVEWILLNIKGYGKGKS